MNNFKIFKYIILILIISSCSSLKEGMSNQKKNNSDEFLVEKKSPLIMPPNFDELPIPGQSSNQNNVGDNTIKKMITGDDNSSNEINKSVESNKNFEKSLIEKINNN